MQSSHFWDAALYTQGSNFQFEQASQFVNENLGSFEDKCILDIGCGTGVITRLIAKKAKKVIGIDISNSMIKTAVESSSNYKNLTFQVGDFNNLSFENEFDVVFSSFALHWAPNKLAVFKNIKKVLKPDGKFFLIIVIRNEELAKARAEAVTSKKWQHYFQGVLDTTEYAREKNYAQYSKQAGLDVDTHTIQKASALFDNKENFRKFLKNIIPNLGRVPEGNRDEFINDIMDNYCLTRKGYSEKYMIDFECVRITGKFSFDFSEQLKKKGDNDLKFN